MIIVGYDIRHFAKQKRLPYNSGSSKATHKFELLYFDIWSPLTTRYIHNYKYFLTILDYFSIYLWIILLKSKT